LAAERYHAPVVVTAHGGDIFALRGPILAQFKRFALRRARAVTTNSRAAERAIRDLVGDLPILLRIPMGATTPPPVERAEVDRIRGRYARSGPLLCFVGRLIEEKGVDDLLEAIALADLPGISAIVIGDGPHRQSLERKRHALGLEDRVHFLGWMARGEVIRHLAAADIFVGLSKPSREGWTESQGMTFAEAMLSGLPVIATSVGGISDSVRDGETGLLVGPSAPREAADAIRRLALDSDLSRRLATAGHAYARQFLTRERTAEAFGRLYAELIEEGKERAPTSVSKADAGSVNAGVAPRRDR
jgi:glycosyltransferase involved in cell wall biosynthesis